MAWLHAAPKIPQDAGSPKPTQQVEPLSRFDQMKKEGIAPSMPPNPMPHLINWLIEIGIMESTGAGPAPLSWREIRAWQDGVRVRLAPWEARLLRQLSIAYIAQSREAEQPNCPPPWLGTVTQQEREFDERQLDMVLG